MPRSIYPWKEWLRAGVLVLHKGVDYTCQPHAMAQQVRNAVQRYTWAKVRVEHVSIKGKQVTITLAK